MFLIDRRVRPCEGDARSAAASVAKGLARFHQRPCLEQTLGRATVYLFGALALERKCLHHFWTIFSSKSLTGTDCLRNLN